MIPIQILRVCFKQESKAKTKTKKKERDTYYK